MEKLNLKTFIRINFIRPDSGKEYHHVTYHFDPNMKLSTLYVRNLLYTYFSLKRNMFFEMGTSIYDLMKTCGCKCTPNYKKANMYSSINAALESLISDKFIEPFDKPVSRYSLNELLHVRIIEENFYMSVRGRNGGDVINEPFFTIDNNEFEKIISLTKYDVPKIFYVYCYIKTRIRFRSADSAPQSSPRMLFESIESMKERYSLSYETVRKYMLIFCEIGLLKVGKLTTHAPGKKAPNVYVLNEDGWETELNNAIHYLDEKRQNNENI